LSVMSTRAPGSASASLAAPGPAAYRAGFDLSLVSGEALTAVARHDAGRLLAAVRYGAPRAALADAPFPVIDVPNPVLGDGPSVELWRSPEPVRVRRHGRFVCAENGTALYAAAVSRVGNDLEVDAVSLYRELLAVAAAAGCPAMQRLWNYVPDINGVQRGVERYKRFSAGRARGYEERFGVPAERYFSASTAIGTTGDALVVTCLAAREPGLHVENPRQVSAFRYPAQYGKRSPSFARGTVSPAALGHAFLLSGTASVVGHESRHPGDLRRQLDETVRNIVTLSEAVGSVWGRSALHLGRFDYIKTYIRRRADFPAVREMLAPRLGPSTSSLWLQADVCRAELLLEIEGVAL